MMPLVGGLCALCAIGAVMETFVPKGDGRESLRLICGLLMLLYVLQGIRDLGQEALQAGSMAEMMDILLG